MYILAGIGIIFLGWGMLIPVAVGVISIWSNGVLMNYSNSEIMNGSAPGFTVILGVLSGWASIIGCALFLLILI